MTTWLVILGAGAATYLTRVTPLVATFVPTHAGLRRYLGDLPVSIIAALAGAGVLAPDQRLTLGPELGAALVVILVAGRTRNLLAAVLVGVILVAAVRSLTGA
jgi:branched-subunit amino acid transport protein